MLREDWKAGETAQYDCGCSPDTLPGDLMRSSQRRGQIITVVRSFTKPDETHDPEVLPMFLVRFPDNYECELWADEMVPR